MEQQKQRFVLYLEIVYARIYQAGIRKEYNK